MSTNANVNSKETIDFNPEKLEEGIRFEINKAEFLWVDNKKQARAFLKRVIKSAEKALKEVDRL